MRLSMTNEALVTSIAREHRSHRPPLIRCGAYPLARFKAQYRRRHTDGDERTKFSFFVGPFVSPGTSHVSHDRSSPPQQTYSACVFSRCLPLPEFRCPLESRVLLGIGRLFRSQCEAWIWFRHSRRSDTKFYGGK